MQVIAQVKRSDGSIKVQMDIGDAILAPTKVGYAIEWLWIKPDLRTKGVGRTCLSFLKTLFSGVFEPVCVVDNAKPFWSQMAREGLCVYFEGQHC